jgi:hypothetical protein
MALVSLPPHKFLRPPFCYYGLQGIKNYEVRVAFSSIIFVKICPMVQKSKGVTDSHEEHSDLIGLLFMRMEV